MGIPYHCDVALPCEQIRQLDATAIEKLGIPGLILMENAGRNIAEIIYESLHNPAASHVVILCGPGNNGGDGYVIARHLHNGGVAVTTVSAVDPICLKGDAALNFGVWERMEGDIIDASDSDGLAEVGDVLADANVIVDALLGTGSGGNPRGCVAKLVAAANEKKSAKHLAVDIPSGLDGDTGTVGEPCFRAEMTVTLLAAKVGFAQPTAREVLGELVVAGIGLPREWVPGQNPKIGLDG